MSETESLRDPASGYAAEEPITELFASESMVPIMVVLLDNRGVGIHASDIAEQTDERVSTVYRNIERLHDLGVIEVSEDEHNRTVFALKDHPVKDAFEHLYMAVTETVEGPWEHNSLFDD